MEQLPGNGYQQTAVQDMAPDRAPTKSAPTIKNYLRSSIHSITPPPSDPPFILQRADEVNAVLRMVSEAQTNVVVLRGDPGVGKSTLAALLFRRLQVFTRSGSPVARHFIWLTLGPGATLPEVISAILSSLSMSRLDFFLLKPDQQISLLMQVLRRPQENAFVVLDQFEELLNPESGLGLADRGATSLFLDMIQRDIGASCLLLTSYRSPYGSVNIQETCVRSYLVSRISLPEGVALLLQRGVPGSSQQELSLVWQRCGGHVFALVLFSALFALSGFSLSYLLNSPDFQVLWSGEVTLNLIGIVSYYLNPIQHTLIRSLSLFSEPVPLQDIVMASTGEDEGADLSTFESELRVLLNFSLVHELSTAPMRLANDAQARREEHVDEQPGYILHPLFRQYTLDHYLEESGRRYSGELSVSLGVSTEPSLMAASLETPQIAVAAGHMRVAVYYSELAQQFVPAREKRAGLYDVALLLNVVRHLCLGWHWQEAYDLLLSEGLHESLVKWGAWNTLIGLYLAMLPPGGVLNRQDEGQVYSNLGLLYGRLGDYDQSFVYFQQALAISREVDDEQGQVITLTNQGELFRSQGQWQQARINFEQALKLNQKHQDPLLESILLHNLGLLLQGEKKYQQALHCYLESLRLARGLKEAYNAGMILTNAGMLLYEQGLLPEAISFLISAFRLRRSIQDPSVNSILLIFHTLEQHMGSEVFARLFQTAQAIQETPEEILSRLVASNMRQ